MKKAFAFLFLLMGFSLFLKCGSNEKQGKFSGEERALSINKDEFGWYIRRGLTKTSEDLAPGYIMYCPSNSASVYLINRAGQVVHEWKGNYETHSPYLNDDGSITVMAVDPDYPVFWGGGQRGRIQKIGWDSRMLWDFEYATDKEHVHHDIAVKPNGNILSIAWEVRNAQECREAGRIPELTPSDGIWPTRIIEIVPEGKAGGTIVWEWHIWDHLIQDADPNAENYGKISAHPELLNINLGDSVPPPISQDSLEVLFATGRADRNQTIGNHGSDAFHMNAINYNSELEQIAISSYQLGEIYILDQSTTTEVAAGHQGGRWGKGGDFLYRWGNPANYHQGDSTDRRLFHQHDVRWIEEGKPGAGNLTVYDNDIPLIPDSLHYSAVYELQLPMAGEGEYVLGENGRYGPEEPVWRYMAPDTISFYGSFISGAHRMENGNTFIDEGPKGRFFEVTPDGKIVWEYRNPFRGTIHKPNGDPINPKNMTYSAFRATFIPADHPGLEGRDLSPLDPQPAVFELPPKEADGIP